MPLYLYFCENCEKFVKRIASTTPLKAPRCKICGDITNRSAQPATSRITETLDNGLMSRRVERPADADRLYRERAAADQDRINNPKV